MSELINEYWNAYLSKMFIDAMWIIIGIITILFLVYGIEFYLRWREIGRKYRT